MKFKVGEYLRNKETHEIWKVVSMYWSSVSRNELVYSIEQFNGVLGISNLSESELLETYELVIQVKAFNKKLNSDATENRILMENALMGNGSTTFQPEIELAPHHPKMLLKQIKELTARVEMFELDFQLHKARTEAIFEKLKENSSLGGKEINVTIDAEKVAEIITRSIQNSLITVAKEIKTI